LSVARVWEKTSACKVLAGKREDKKPLGRLRQVWEDNIKMDHK
jgi:hypothetical protein